MNMQDFYTGHAFDAYEFFGAHTYFGGTHFAVWAPSAQHIAVETEIGTFDLHRTQSAVWECDAPGVQAGMVYQYWVRGANGQSVAHCDPYGTAMTLRPDGRSIVSDAPKSFSDDKWMQERTKCFDKPLNIYEVHAGSWRQKEDGSWYTYAELADLLPDYFSFVKGIVDSQDLSLNISREMLQKDSQLKLIHNALEKKIKNELHAMLNNDRAKYEEFWKEFGRQIKFGAYSDYGMHAELLRDLLLFWSAKEQKMVTLQEYVDKMPAEQKYIYFAAGDSTDRLAKLPSAELVLDKGFDVLLLTEDVDEFCLQIMRTYPRKDAEGKDGTVEFKNVNSGDLGLESEEEKKAAEDATAENKALFDAMKDALNGKVKEVKVSTRLKDHPVCLSADGPLSIEMEKVLSKQPGSEGVKSDKVLELNANHPVFAVLKAAQEAGDTDKLKKYSALLYAQAQLIEGLPVDDPAAYAEAVCSLMK